MNKQQTIYTILFWIILVLFAYIVILQPKVNAGNEILEIQQRLQELDDLEQWEKDKWHIDEWAKYECIDYCNTTFWKQQEEESKKAQEYRDERELLKNRLGLLLQR